MEQLCHYIYGNYDNEKWQGLMSLKCSLFCPHLHLHSHINKQMISLCLSICLSALLFLSHWQRDTLYLILFCEIMPTINISETSSHIPIFPFLSFVLSCNRSCDVSVISLLWAAQRNTSKMWYYCSVVLIVKPASLLYRLQYCLSQDS